MVCILTGNQLKDPNATVAYHGNDKAFFEDCLGSRGVRTAQYANRRSWSTMRSKILDVLVVKTVQDWGRL